MADKGRMSYRSIRHRGWMLVETGTGSYSACKGSERRFVGRVHHGDWDNLVARFRERVDEAEDEGDHDGAATGYVLGFALTAIATAAMVAVCR